MIWTEPSVTSNTPGSSLTFELFVCVTLNQREVPLMSTGGSSSKSVPADSCVKNLCSSNNHAYCLIHKLFWERADVFPRVMETETQEKKSKRIRYLWAMSALWYDFHSDFRADGDDVSLCFASLFIEAVAASYLPSNMSFYCSFYYDTH